MGAQSTKPALTENRDDPDPVGAQVYVGVDVGRRTHRVAAISRQRMEDGSWERAAVRRFSTSGAGFQSLTDWLAGLAAEPGAVRIGCEPTGGWYARTVVAWLEQHHYRVEWLQNWAIHDRRQLLIGKQAKTDALDARLIARLLFEQEWLGRVGGFLHRPPRTADGLRLLVRNRLKLLGVRNRYRLQLTGLEDVLFPEFKEFFRTSTTGLVARLVLESFPTPAQLAAADPAQLAAVVVKQGHAGRLARRLAELREKAAHSAGLTEDIEQLVRSQRWLLQQLRLVDQEIELVESAVLDALQAWPAEERSILESFPGMSPWRQAALLASIGDLASFRNDRQLRKLLGWYPEVIESGTSVARHRLGTRGSRIGRRELWLWALQLVSPNLPPTPFRAYYRRLRARGMVGQVAIGHLAGKLISVLFYCLRTGQPYDPARHARALDLDDVYARSEAMTSTDDAARRGQAKDSA